MSDRAIGYVRGTFLVTAAQAERIPSVSVHRFPAKDDIDTFADKGGTGPGTAGSAAG